MTIPTLLSVLLVVVARTCRCGFSQQSLNVDSQVVVVVCIEKMSAADGLQRTRLKEK